MASTPDPELEYLSPDFDPASLTIPKLRGIFVAHSVSYPSSAKKGQLVDIFNEQVAPQAKRILSSRARTKRSARGIVNVPSSQETSLSDDGEAAEEETSEEQLSRTPHTASKKASRKSVEDTSPDRPSATARSAKKKMSKSFVSSDEVDYSADASPFSADNPFQSGSSPLVSARSTSGERRRKTLGPEDSKDRRKHASPRRKTDYVAGAATPAGTSTAPVSTKFSIPVSRIIRGDEQVSADEEFTPEEQQDLAQEQQRTGKAVRPPKKRKTSSSSGSFARVAPWTISLAMLGGIATVWRQEKISVGFCGVGKESQMLAGVEIPEWANAIRPQCEPCPPHAYCYDGLQASCEPDFIYASHPLSLGGIVPLPPSCEPDGEKARKVRAVADRAVAELRDRNAKFECGDLKDDEDKRVESPELEEPKLKEKVGSKRRKGMSQEEFEELWQPALDDLIRRDEIVSNVHEHAGRHSLRSVSLANIPLGCAIRRSLRNALARHLWKFVGSIIIAGIVFYTRARVASGRAASARAKQLASFALDRLATQATLHAEDSARFSEPWISMSQLRDDVLRDEFSTERKQMLWDRVQKIVEDNANIRSMVREQRSGDVGRVWEWTGAFKILDDNNLSGVAGNGRKSSRSSVGFNTDRIPSNEPVTRAKPEISERKTWDDGRPIY